MKLGFSLLTNWGIDDVHALVDLASRGNVFGEHGIFSDEAIAVMRVLWSQEDPRFDGSWSRFSGMKFSPKPTQKPSIPIVIGGVSRPRFCAT
jgi:alkanesulfonate monooxygenase SsuD/methylene tetrahydromethanopterin reductase-like flavin-dependent oxidoreductase (luciferase family)